MTQPSDALVWTRRELCPLMKMGLTKVTALIVSGELPSIKIGGQRLVRDSDLRQYIAAQPVDVPAAGAR